MSDQFQWWRDALAGNTGAIEEPRPRSGYFKLRDKPGSWQPVAIWERDGELICRVGADLRDAHDVWTWCAKNPVAKDAAKHAFEHGSWPGDVPVAGHNSGTLSLPEEIDDAATHALAWLHKNGIADKTAADTAANWRARLLDLSKQADKQRETEKRPHDEASKAVQAKWKPVVETATDAANRLRDALTAWMRAEDARARAELEAKRREAEEAARKQREATEVARREAEAKNLPPPPEPEDVPLPFVEPEPVRVQAGGQRGRKAGLRTITKYVVTDYAAALAHVKDHPDVRAAVEKVSAQQAKAGASVPGVETLTEQVAA
jgi:hypothetical protein